MLVFAILSISETDRPINSLFSTKIHLAQETNLWIFTHQVISPAYSKWSSKNCIFHILETNRTIDVKFDTKLLSSKRQIYEIFNTTLRSNHLNSRQRLVLSIPQSPKDSSNALNLWSLKVAWNLATETSFGIEKHMERTAW